MSEIVSDEMIQENNLELYGPRGSLPWKFIRLLGWIGETTAAAWKHFLFMFPQIVWGNGLNARGNLEDGLSEIIW